MTYCSRCEVRPATVRVGKDRFCAECAHETVVLIGGAA